VTAGDHLPQGLLGVETAAALVDIGDLHVSPTSTDAPVGLLEPDDRLEEGGLADAVGADDSDDAVARQA
jgi:hypothetical protein